MTTPEQKTISFGEELVGRDLFIDPVVKHYLLRLDRASDLLAREGDIMDDERKKLAHKTAFDSWIYLQDAGYGNQADLVRNHYIKTQDGV